MPDTTERYLRERRIRMQISLQVDLCEHSKFQNAIMEIISSNLAAHWPDHLQSCSSVLECGNQQYQHMEHSKTQLFLRDGYHHFRVLKDCISFKISLNG